MDNYVHYLAKLKPSVIVTIHLTYFFSVSNKMSITKGHYKTQDLIGIRDGVTSGTECSLLCLAEDTCAAASLNLHTKTCMLHDKTSSMLAADDDYEYYQFS